MATFSWDGGAGNFEWENPVNWDNDSVLPGSGDDVVIPDLLDTPTIIANSTIAVHNLTSAEHLQVTGGSLTVLGTATLNGGLTQSGGALTAFGGFTVSSASIQAGTASLGSETISDLVSLYKAEGNANDGADGNNGALVNGATTTTGKIGSAFSFDGIDDYVSVPHSANLDLTAAATYSAWIKLDQLPLDAGHTMSIMAKSANGNDLDFQIQMDNKVYFYAANGSVVSSTALTAGTWHHVAATYQGSSFAKVYVNGVLEGNASISGTRAANTNPLMIGENSVFTGRHFKGQVDEAMVFDRAITDSEIARLAAATIISASGSTLIIPTGHLTGPVNLSSTGILAGSGTITGNLTNAAIVAPGNSPGIITVNGDYSQTSAGDLNIELGGTTAGTQFDQLIVNGTVTLNGDLNVSLINSFVPTNGNSFTIIDNDGSDAVSGTFSGLSQGAAFVLGDSLFTISYVGGTGNDVVLTAGVQVASTVALSGNDLVIADTGSATNDAMTISTNGTNVTIQDASNNLYTAIAGATGSGTNTLVVPLSAFTGSIVVNGGDGNDSLTINLGSGNFGRAITFNGGGQTTGDSLTVTGGGTFASVAHNFTNANDGSISVTGNSTISYTGLEPITDNLSATDRVFTFSGGDDAITLVNATGAAMTIDSNFAESVTFANPTNSLTINAGNGADTVAINSVDGAFAATLTVNGDGGTDSITLAAALSLGSGSLSFNAETINLGASVQTDGGSVSLTGNTIVTASSVLIDTESGNDGTPGSVMFSGGSLSANVAGNDLSIQATTSSLGGNVTLGTVSNSGGAYLNDLTIDASGSSVGTITLNGDLSTDNSGSDTGDLNFNGQIVLTASQTWDTEQGDDSNGGSVDFRNATASASTAGVDLTIRTTAIGFFGNSIHVGSFSNPGGAYVNDLTLNTGDLWLWGSSVSLDNNGADTGDLSITTGGLLLVQNQVLDTEQGNDGDGGLVTISAGSGTWGAGGGLDLSINTATTLTNGVGGNVTYNQPSSGFGDKLNDFTINASGTTSGTISLGGDILTDATGADTGDISLTGQVVLTASQTWDTEQGGDASAGTVTINGTVNADNAGTQNRTLAIDVGTNSVTFGDAVGGTQALADLDVAAGTINVNGNVTVDDQGGNLLTWTGAVVLGANVVIDVDAASGTDNSLTVSGSVNADAAANNRTLQVTSGGGTINLSGSPVGASQALQSLITSSTVASSFNSIRTRDGGISLSAGGSPAVTISGDLSTDSGTNAGNITITGSLGLSANVAIDTDHASGTDGNFSVSGATNATSGNRTLTLDAGGGTITFSAGIGGSTALQALTVNSASSATFSSITTKTGGVSITATTINLNGNVSTDELTNSGSATFNGAVVIGANTVTIDTDNTATDGNILFNGTVNADNAATQNRTLVVNAGSGSVTFGGAIGGTQALADLDVTAGTINVNANVTVDDRGGNTLTWTGAVVLGANVVFDVNGSADNSVSFNGTINADNSTTANRTLDVQADTGTVTFGGSLGAETNGALADFDVTATTITLNGATIQVDDQATSAQTVTFNGAVVLGTGVTIDTDATSGNDNSVRFTNLSDAISGANSLTVNAGGGSAQFDGAIGSPTRLTDFDVTAATIRLPNDVLTDGGSLTFVGNVVLNLSGQLTIDTELNDDSNAGNVTFSGGSISAGGANRDLVINTTTGGANTSGNISLSTVNSSGGFALRHLTLNSSQAVTTSASADVTLTGAITLASDGNLDIDARTVTLSTSSSDVAISGTGTISVDASRNVLVSSQASLTTVNGNLTVNANQQGTPTSGNFVGIDLNNGLIQATGTGAVTVQGKGGTDSNGFQIGVRILVGGQILGGTSALLTVAGTSGASSGTDNHGIFINGSGSTITSSGGNVEVTGTSSTVGSGSNGRGILMEASSQISAGGSGSVTVLGEGSDLTTGSGNFGLYIVNSTITSSGGNVAVTGNAGGMTTSGTNRGVQIEGASEVSATGTGTVTVTGVGGTGSGGGNQGIRLRNANAKILSAGGAIQITGTAGQAGGDTIGFMSDATGSVSGGPITFIADSIAFTSPTTINAGTGTVTIRPQTNGTAINLGSTVDTTASTLELSDAELDGITARTVQIGDANSGAITVSAAISHANNLSLTTGAGITVNQAVTMASDKSFTATTTSTTAGISLPLGTSDIAASGTGTISLTAAREVALASGASLSAVNGNITVNANQQTTATTGIFFGIDVNGAEVKTTGSGAVNLTGRGGTIGVAVRSAGNVSATGGTVTIVGTGNNGVIDGNIGVSLGSGATVTSTTGALSITGTGGVTIGNSHDGIRIDGGASVNSTGGATVTLNGTGKGADSGNNYGVRITGTNSKVTSNAGDILVTGAGAVVTHVGNVGVAVVDGGQINATNSAKVTVNATGGISAANNIGLLIAGTNGGITSVNGDVTLNGTAADSTGTGNHGISIHSGGFVTTTGTANLTLTGSTANSDPAVGYGISLGSSGTATFTLTGAQNAFVANSMDISATATINAGSNTINLRQKATDGSMAIDLGAADSSTVLGLTDAELDRVTAGTVNIGDENSGTITVSSAITHGNNLSLTTGAGITVDQAVTMASDKNFSATTTSTTAAINLATTNSDIAATGTGTISLTASRDLLLATDSSLTTVNGNLTVSANQQVTATSGDFVGVKVAGVIAATGTGAVSVSGRGGDSGSATHQIGVWVNNGRIGHDTEVVGAGTVTVTGQGGASAGAYSHYGVYVFGSAGRITSGGGAVSVNGTGGGAEASDENFGVALQGGAKITSAGTGAGATVTVVGQGVGAAGTGGSSDGVWVEDSEITSGGGNVSVTGTGGNGTAGSRKSGVLFTSGGVISAGGSGTVTVTGTGGSGSGGNQRGIYMSQSNARITSSGGAITINATADETANNIALEITGDALILGTTGNPTVTINADSMRLESTTSIDVGSNTVNLRPLTGGQTIAIDLGGSDSANVLGLTDTELDSIIAGTLNIGNASSGTITVSSAITHAAATNLVLTTGGSINFSGSSALLDANGGNVTLNAGSGAITSGSGLKDVRANGVTLAGGASGIGSNSNPLITEATSLTATTSGSGSSYLSEIDTVNVGSLLNFLGSVNLMSGTFRLTPGGGIDGFSPVFIDSAAVLQLNGTEQYLNSLSGSGRITNDSNSITPGILHVPTMTSSTFSGVLGGVDADDNNFSLSTEWGSGTFTLTGANTYTGATAVNSGTLAINGSITSDVVVGASGTLKGSGTITGNVSGTGTFSPGNSPGVMTINGNFTPSGTVNFEVNNAWATAGTDFDQYVVNGGVDLTGATLTFSNTNDAAAPTANSLLTLINNSGTSDPTTVASTPAQGAVVTIGSRSFRIFYNGGDGNDVVIVENSTPTVVYVDDSFTQNDGVQIADADLGTTGNQAAIKGITAFASINAALAAVSSSGTIIVNGGTYAEAVSLTGTQTLEITGPDSAQAVIIDDLTTIAGTPVVIEGSSNLTVGDADSRTLDGVISGSGSFTKQGAGTYTLTAANTYSGATTISAGTLALQSTYGSSSFSIATSSILELNVDSGSTQFATAAFSGAGTLRKTGAGVAYWGVGSATFNMASGSLIDVQAGTFTGGSSGNEVWTNNLSDLNVASGAAFNGVEADVRVDAITGSGTITSGYSGGGSVTFGLDNASSTFDGIFAETHGPGTGFVKAGTGTITLNGASTHTSTTTVSAGTLKLGNNAALGSEAGKTVVQSGATLDINGFKAGANSNELVEVTGSGVGGNGAIVNSGGGSYAFRRLTMTGDTTIRTVGGIYFDDTPSDSDGSWTLDMGGFALTKIGTEWLQLRNNTTIANEGDVLVNQGRFVLEHAVVFDGPTRTISVADGATLSIANSSSQTHNVQLALANNSTVYVSDSSTTVTGQVSLTGTPSIVTGSDLTLSGKVTGTGNLSKSDAATLTLSNNSNDYSGATNITQGILKLGSANALGTTAGGTTVSDGAVLDLNGQAIGAEAVTLNGTGISSGGALINSSGTAASLSGNITLASASSIGGSGNATYSGTVNGGSGLTLVGAGTKTFSGVIGGTTPLTSITQNDATGAVQFDNDVSLGSGGATFNANVTLDGLTFTSGGAVTFGNAESDTLTISGAATTVTTTSGNATLNSTTTGNEDFSLGTTLNPIAGGITFNAPVTMVTDKNLTANAGFGVGLVNTNSDLSTSGSGAISITANRVIELSSGSSIAVVDGDMTLTAHGAFFHQLDGISVGGATLTTSGTGDIQLTGTGAQNGGRGVNFGFSVISSTSLLPTAGNITIHGTASAGFVSYDRTGVRIDNTHISTLCGDITITGVGAAGSYSNNGVSLLTNVIVSSSGTGSNAGTITIDGTAVAVADSNGVAPGDGPAIVTSVDGAITITGTAPSGGSNTDVSLAGSVSSLSLISTGTANITVNADTMYLETGGAINAGSNTVTLRPRTPSTVAINLGGSDAAATLGLTDAELDRVTAGTINIGDANSGAITFSADITRAASTNINLTTGSGNNIAFGAFSLNAGSGGDVTLTTSGSGAITTGDNTGTDLTADDVTLNAGAGDIGTTTNYLRLAANTVAGVSNGNISLIEADSINVRPSGLNAGTGTVTLGGGAFVAEGSVTAGATNVVTGSLSLGSTISNLVSLYQTEGNANDGAGGNHGSLVNGATTTSSGKIGSAFSLEGATDHVSIPDSTSLRPTNVTVAGWFNWSSPPLGTDSLVSKAVGTANWNSYELWFFNGNLYAIAGRSTGVDFVNAAFSPVAGNWYHVAMTFDDTNNSLALYINGSRVASTTSTVSIEYDSHPVLIGNATDNEVLNNNFDGKADEVMIFNRALSAGEVASLAAAYNERVSGSTLSVQTGQVVGPATTSGSGTLIGSGIVSGSLTNSGSVSPGDSPGIITVNGNYTQESSGSLNLELNGTNANALDYDQIFVNGTVTLNDGSLNITLGFTPANDDLFTIISNDGTDAVQGLGTFKVGGNSIPDGGAFYVGLTRFVIDYTGGSNNNDVTLLVQNYTTEATLDGSGNLIITDIQSGGQSDTLTIKSDTTNSKFILHDPNRLLGASGIAGATGTATNTLEIPFASVTGSQVFVNTLAGNDSLTVDLSLGNFGKTLTYNGGTQAASDSLMLTGGGTFASVAHTLTNANDGSIVITGNSTISYTGLEPIADNLSAIDRVFSFNGGDEVISLIDAAGANMTIDSTVSEEVTFANPTGSLTINAGSGSDTVTISSVDTNGPFNAALTINGGTGDDSINLNADLTFASNRNLDVDLTNDDASPGIDAISVGSNANLILSGSGAATLKASKNIAFAGGSSIAVANGGLTVSANQGTTATTGDFIGVNFDNGGNLSTVNGNILVEGRGGDTENDHGVQTTGNTISSAGSGTLTLHGIGVGASSRGLNSTFGGLVTSVSGDISITGESSQDNGIELNFGSDFVSTGTGVNAADILVIGTTTSTGSEMVGVRLHNSSGDINTVDGNVELRGTTASSSGFGVSVGAGFDITATGTGSVTLDGDGVTVGVTLGDAGASGTITTNSGAVIVTSPDDVTITNQGTITATTGSVTITADDDSTGTGLVTLSGSVQFNTTGNISVNATDLIMSGTINAGSGAGAVALTTNTLNLTGTVDGSGTLTIKPRAATTSIGVGASATGTLNLNDTELTKLLDGFSSITIGDVASGTGAVDINTSTFNDSVTIAGSSISVTELAAGSNSVTLIARTGAITDGGDSGTDMTGGTVSLQTLGTSGGTIGAGGDVISIAATSLNSNSSASNGSQFVSEADSVTIDATGLNAGTGTISLTSGTFTLGGSNRINDVTDINVSGGSTLALGANSETIDQLILTDGSITGSGTGKLTGTSMFDLRKGSVSAILAGSAGLLKTTSDTVTLIAANTYSGATTIDAGVLNLSGSIASSVTVNTPGTLTGSATINGSVSSAGSISPGNSNNSASTFLINGNYSESSTNDLNLEIGGLTAGTQFDRLVVNGAVTLAGDLNVSLLSGFAPVYGNSFKIIDNDGTDFVNGTFNGLSEGATFVSGGTTFKISYVGGTGNDVVLSLPTPDIKLTSVTANGNTTLTVQYEILNSALAAPLKLRFLRSIDQAFNTGDVSLGEVSITNVADLTVGSHQLMFAIGTTVGSQVQLPGAISTQKDVDTDYYILGAIDPANVIPEVDADPFSEDNTAVLTGVYATSKAIYVHGGESADTVSLTYPTSASGNITVNVSGFGAPLSYAYSSGLQFRVRTHGGDDSISITNFDSTLARPMFEFGGEGNDTLSGGIANDTLLGGNGTDMLVATGNVNFVLANKRLTGLGTDTLSSLEVANLTGGASSKTFTVTGWTGTGTINGGSGASAATLGDFDTIVASKSGSFILTDASLQTDDGMSLALNGIIRATLTGGADDNSFALTGWTGSGRITGGAGIDTLSITRNTDMTLKKTSLIVGTSNTFNLATLETVELTGGLGNNTFTADGWLGNASFMGGGGNDTVVARYTSVTNASFTLANDLLVIQNSNKMNLSEISLSDIRTASLIGGTSANTYDVGGWTGSGSLIGGGGKGIDTVIASADADFTLSGDQLVLTSGLNMTLTVVKRASLMGLVQTHRFVVTGWTPAGTSDVAAGVLLQFSR